MFNNRNTVFFLSVFFLFAIYFIEVSQICRVDNIDVYLRSILFNILLAIFITIVYSRFSSRWLGVVLLLFLGIIEYSNLVYIRFTGNPLSVLSILYVSNVGHISGSILRMVKFFDILYFLPAIYFAIKKHTPYKLSNKQFAKKLLVFAVVYVAFQFISYRNLNFYQLFDRTYSVNKTENSYKNTILSNIVIELTHIATQKKLTKDERGAYNQLITDKYFEKDVVIPQKFNYNIVYILVEALESWPINKKYKGEEITPFMNSLLSQDNTTTLLNITPHIQIGRTVDAQLMINTGLFASRKLVTFQDFYKNKYFTLPDILKKYNGIQSTSVCVGDIAGFYNRDRMLPNLGFEKYIYRDKLDDSEAFNMGMSDESFLKQMVKFLDQEQKPFFSHFVTLSTHSPYKIPEKFKKMNINDKEMMENYIQSANYADNSLRLFFEEMKKKDYYDSTIFILNGDHEGLAGSDRISAMENTAIRSIVPDEFYVPMIIVNDPNPLGVVEKTLSQIDIFPTLINHLGIKSPWKGLGMNALDSIHPSIGIYSNYSMQGGNNGSYKDSFLSQWDLSEKILENNLFVDSVYNRY